VKRKNVLRPAIARDRQIGRLRAKASILERDGIVCAALFVLAALVRVLFLLGTVDRDLPFSILYYGDSRVYREFALALLRGESYDQGIPFHPPLFAVVLAAIIRVVGENPRAMRALLAALSSAAVPLTYLLGRRLWDRRVALTGALLSTLSFGLCVAAVSPNAEAVYIPLLVGQALLAVFLGDSLAGGGERQGGWLQGRGHPSADIRGREGRQGGGVRDEEGTAREKQFGDARRVRLFSVASGLLLGLGSLTRAEHLLLALLLPAALVLGRPRLGLRRLATVTAVILGTAAIVVLPWTVHNYLALSAFNRANPDLAEPLPVVVLVSSYGALNFALANGPGADGTFKPDPIVAATGSDRLDFRDPRQLSIYLHGYRRGLAYLAGNPAQAAPLLGRKVAIALESGALGLGLSNWPGGLAGTRRAVDMFVPDSRRLLPISVLLLAAGAWQSRSLWRRGGVIWLMGLHKLVICAAFFGYVRLFVQLAPFAYLLQACALVALVERLRPPLARKAAAASGIALAALLTLELGAAAVRPRRFNASGSADTATGKIIQDAEVRIAPRP